VTAIANGPMMDEPQEDRMSVSEPQHNEVRQLWVWEDRAAGRPMESAVWHTPFPKDMDLGGEGYPIGTAAAVGNSHNSNPLQTLVIVLRDFRGFQNIAVPFANIKNGYQPQGDAHDLLHRDFPWQDNQLKVLAFVGGALVRVYTWRYLVQQWFRWDRPNPAQPGRWVPV
jgi:hypothetical protein